MTNHKIIPFFRSPRSFLSLASEPPKTVPVATFWAPHAWQPKMSPAAASGMAVTSSLRRAGQPWMSRMPGRMPPPRCSSQPGEEDVTSNFLHRAGGEKNKKTERSRAVTYYIILYYIYDLWYYITVHLYKHTIVDVRMYFFIVKNPDVLQQNWKNWKNQSPFITFMSLVFVAFRRLHPETRHGYARPISDVGDGSSPARPWAVPLVPAVARAPHVGPPDPPPLPNRTFLTDTMEEVGGVASGYQGVLWEMMNDKLFNTCVE